MAVKTNKTKQNTSLSRVTLFTFGILAAIGLVQGIMIWQDKPATVPQNDPASNAIITHIIIAAVSLVLVVAIQRYRSARKLSNIWLAPLSERAFARFKATFVPRQLTITGIGRMILTLLPLFLILWTPYRSAMQVFAALNPTVTANAWGGPSYLGASLAHWMDGLALLYFGALLLHFILVKLPSKART